MLNGDKRRMRKSNGGTQQTYMKNFEVDYRVSYRTALEWDWSLCLACGQFWSNDDKNEVSFHLVTCVSWFIIVPRIYKGSEHKSIIRFAITPGDLDARAVRIFARAFRCAYARQGDAPPASGRACVTSRCTHFFGRAKRMNRGVVWAVAFVELPRGRSFFSSENRYLGISLFLFLFIGCRGEWICKLRSTKKGWNCWSLYEYRSA